MKRAIVVALLSFVIPASAFAQAKPRVAVFPLEFGTVKSEAAAVFGTGTDAGKGIADLIVDGLIGGGKFTVFERSQLDKVMAEQDKSNSSRFEASSAAAIGKILGVQAVVIGSITKLGKEDRNTLGYRSTKGMISLSVRVVDTSTAEVLFSAKGDGEVTRRGLTLSNPSGNEVAFGSNFKELVIGEATAKAVDETVARLNAQVSQFPLATEGAPVSGASSSVGSPKPAVAALTVDTLVEMLNAKVPEDQIVEIIQTHEQLAINPLDPSWVITVARQSVSLKVQNAVRARAGLAPLTAAAAPGSKSSTAPPPARAPKE
jgi:curli biogenesis system outer membrane secretion channel CsgG